MTKRLWIQHGWIGCFTILCSMAAAVNPSDAELGLHSGGGPWQFYPAPDPEAGRARVLLIGDSIMNHYRATVGKELEGAALPKADIDVWLTPLYLKSPELLHDLRIVLKQGPYDVVHFNIGLHDWPPERILPEEYEPRLRAYAQVIQEEAGDAHLIWASTTQITAEGKPEELDPNDNPTIVARNAIAARVMQELGIEVDDLYGLMSDKLEMAIGDRFHWKPEGQAVQGRQVAKYIAAALESRAAIRPEAPNPYRLVWTSAGKNSLDSMPAGNGDLALNLWVEEGGDLLFYISKTDAWSENARLLKLGRVRVSLSPNPFVPGAPFRQELRLRSGEIRVQAGEGERATRLRVWVDANHPVIQVDARSRSPIEAKISLETWRNERRELTGEEIHSAYGLNGEGGPRVFVEPDTVLAGRASEVVWYHRNERSLWSDNMRLQALGGLIEKRTDPILYRTFGALMRGKGLVADGDKGLRTVAPTKRFSLGVHALTAQTKTPEEWVARVEAQAAEIEGLKRRERAGAHRAWWEAFWKRSYIHVTAAAPDERERAEAVTRGYALQRYINACGGRGGSPIKFNGSIFTVDTLNRTDRFKGYDADYRQWGGPYWWQNTRLPYWSMLASGDYDLVQPLFRMYREALDLATERTRLYYKHDGAFFPETMTFWGTYADCNYGRNREAMPDGLTENLYIRYYWQGGLELSLLMLDHFAHTADEAFARETLVPFASEILTFFDQHWKRDAEGKIRFDPAMALETYRKAVNPMPEIVGIRKVATEMLALPESLTTALQREQWKRMLGELPAVPMHEVDGETLLAPAQSYSEKQNSENVELYAIFPYRAYGLGKPDLELARRSFDKRAHKGTGGWNQNAIKAALLGLSEEAADLVATNFMSKDPASRFPAFWGPNYDWIPDQDHGSVAMIALQRMLLQSDGDEIRLMPAWPKGWNVEFRLCAPRATTVQGVWRAGKMESLEVEPKERKKDTVAPPGV